MPSEEGRRGLTHPNGGERLMKRRSEVTMGAEALGGGAFAPLWWRAQCH